MFAVPILTAKSEAAEISLHSRVGQVLSDKMAAQLNCC